MQINEEIRAGQSIVYHRTGKDYDGAEEKIAANGFRIGRGAMYGPGVYTTYDIESQQMPYMRSTYGPIIVECRVLNTRGFLIFDKMEAKKIYGQRSDILSQLSTILHKPTDWFIKTYPGIDELITAHENAQFSSELASAMWDKYPTLLGHTAGLIYSGSKDGRCLLAYHDDNVVPNRYIMEDYSGNQQGGWKPAYGKALYQRIQQFVKHNHGRNQRSDNYTKSAMNSVDVLGDTSMLTDKIILQIDQEKLPALLSTTIRSSLKNATPETIFTAFTQRLGKEKVIEIANQEFKAGNFSIKALPDWIQASLGNAISEKVSTIIGKAADVDPTKQAARNSFPALKSVFGGKSSSLSKLGGEITWAKLSEELSKRIDDLDNMDYYPFLTAQDKPTLLNVLSANAASVTSTQFQNALYYLANADFSVTEPLLMWALKFKPSLLAESSMTDNVLKSKHADKYLPIYKAIAKGDSSMSQDDAFLCVVNIAYSAYAVSNTKFLIEILSVLTPNDISEVVEEFGEDTIDALSKEMGSYPELIVLVTQAIVGNHIPRSIGVLQLLLTEVGGEQQAEIFSQTKHLFSQLNPAYLLSMVRNESGFLSRTTAPQRAEMFFRSLTHEISKSGGKMPETTAKMLGDYVPKIEYAFNDHIEPAAPTFLTTEMIRKLAELAPNFKTELKAAITY